ncbi:hypothetical protein [Streptococcus pluranimalium]|uniref:hypothetical protein n=1 Tax=Streptococcus pluranimalium TaxID=82348 RepID=UPI004046CAE8
MKKKLWKQWRFWMEVVLGLLLVLSFGVIFILSDEINNINKALSDGGMSYNQKNKEIVFNETSNYGSEIEESTDEEIDEVIEESSTEESSDEPIDPSGYNEVDYNEWNHDKLETLEPIKITGKVIQFLKDDSEVNLRVAINDNYDTIALVSMDTADYKDVIAENDNITVYGMNGGLTSYETTLGSEVTIPSLFATEYTINFYGN